MSTGEKGEVEDLEQAEAESVPVTKLITKAVMAFWKLVRGWRAPTAEED